MKIKMKMGLLAVFAGVAPWIACGGGTEVGTKISSGSGGSAVGTGGNNTPGLGGATGTGGAVGTGGSGGPAGAGAGGTTATGGTVGGVGGAVGAGGMVGGTGGMVGGTGGAAPLGPIKVLIWNNALTYGHQSRITAIPLLRAREATDNIMFDTKYAHLTSLPEGQVDATSDPSVFTDAGLDPYDVIFFLNTTGNTIDQDGQGAVHRQALINFMKKGRGFVGTHSATDTYQGTAWTWYVDFMGANFASHSNTNTQGTARYYQNMTHPILTAAATPNPWSRAEEWYTFTRDPLSSAIPGIKILMDCTDVMVTTQRSIAWVHEMPLEAGAPRAGRMFYNAMGHFVAAFQEKAFMDQIIDGIKWAAYRL